MKKRYYRMLCVVTLGALLASQSARAQSPAGEPAAAPTQAQERSRELVARGNALFQLGRYSEALRLYEEGHLISPGPSKLFNLAQCHAQLKDPEKAIRFYRAYLAAKPEASNYGDVLATVADLEKELAKKDGASAKPVALLPTALPAASNAVGEPAKAPDELSQRSTPFYKTWWFWTIVGVGVVGATVGGVVAGTRCTPMANAHCQ